MLKKILTLLIVVILSVSFANVLATDPLDPDDAEDAPDHDGDGLSNIEEYYNGTDPNNADSDNDGIPDGWEVFNAMDPATPKDAHEDLDYQVASGSFNGEIDAQFSAVRNGFDVWPGKTGTQVASDLHYDNYEEYYRAFNYVGQDAVTKDTPKSYELNGVWVIFGPTDPNEPDSDGDNILDPDDAEPHNFANDGTSYNAKPVTDTDEYPGPSSDKNFQSTQKLRTINAMDSMHLHDSVLIDFDLFSNY